MATGKTWLCWGWWRTGNCSGHLTQGDPHATTSPLPQQQDLSRSIPSPPYVSAHGATSAQLSEQIPTAFCRKNALILHCSSCPSSTCCHKTFCPRCRLISLLQARAVSMNISHLTPGELGFLGGAGWSCGCLSVNGINWEQLAPSKAPPRVPVEGQALVIQLSQGSCPKHIRAHRCITHLMPPGLALPPPPLLCSSCPRPNVAMPATCPVVQQICLDKEQDGGTHPQSAGMSPSPTQQQGPGW